MNERFLSISVRQLFVIWTAVLIVILGCNFTKAVLPAPSTATHTSSSASPVMETEKPTLQPTQTPAPPIIVERHYYEEGEHLRYKINVTYCQIQQQELNYQRFNDVVDQFLNEQIMEFKNAVQETAQMEQSLPIEIDATLEITCETAFVSPQLISVLFNVDTFLGGAHPMLTAHTINYNFTQQAELNLADLFESNSPYLNLLADLCAKDLSSHNALEFPEGVEPKEENFRNWLLRPQGLEIIFDPYQVAPYALGRQTVFVPYSALDLVLKRGGIVEEIRQ